MRDKIERAWQWLPNHWSFWPFLIFVSLIFVYTAVFSHHGYLAFRQQQETKKQLQIQIEELRAGREKLQQKLAILKNDSTALQSLSHDFLLYHENVSIIKFVEHAPSSDDPDETIYHLEDYQKIYIGAATLLLALLTFFFWYTRDADRQD